MLFLFLAGTMGADVEPAPAAQETVAYIMLGGAGVHTGARQAGPRFRYENGRRVGEDLVIRFEHGKPVVVPKPESPAEPERRTEPAPTPGSLPLPTGTVPIGLPALPGTVSGPEPVVISPLSVPKRPKAVKASFHLSLPPITVSATAFAGDGDEDVIRIAELVFGFPLVTSTDEA